MAGENEPTADGKQTQAPGLTRREAMLQLLRVGGVAAGAAAAGVWLSEHSFRPVPAQAEQARRDHRPPRRTSDSQLPQLTVVQGGEPRALVQRALEDLGGIRRFVNVYVNEEDIRFLQNQETALKEGDEVSIIPAIAGG